MKNRHTYIGGSDVASILNLNPWKSAMDLYHEKLQLVPETKPTILMDMGTNLENLITHHAELFFFELTKVPVHGNSLNLDLGCLKAHIDAVLYTLKKNTAKAIIDCKYTTQMWEEIPQQYVLQLNFYRQIYDIKFQQKLPIYIARLDCYGRFKLLECPVINQDLIKVANDFWNNHIIPKIPPVEIVTLEKSMQKRNSLKATQKIKERTKEYNDLNKQIKLLTKKKDLIKEQFQHLLKIYDWILDDNGKKLVSKTISQIKSLDTKKLKDQDPELYNKYVKIISKEVIKCY